MALPPEDPHEPPLMAGINTTPLVDVMLVLLIIFLITVPVVSSSVALSLPREPAPPAQAAVAPVLVSVDTQGRIHWFDTPLPDVQALVPLLGRVAALQPQPEVHIRVDQRVPYALVDPVVQLCELMGIARIGFVTELPVQPADTR